MSQLKIKSKPRCTPPSITNVVQLDNSSVTVSWVLNGIDYTSGSMLVEVSTNGGASFIALQTVSPTNLTVTINNAVLATLSNGQEVLFRLTGNSFNCSNMSSEIFKLIWTKQIAQNFDYVMPYSCSSRGGDGPTNYDVTCEGKDRLTLFGVTGLNAQYRMKASGDAGHFGMTRQNNATIANGELITATELLFVWAYQSEAGYPGNYPWGQHILLPPTVYRFEYSSNNGATWYEFTITFKE